MAMPTASSFQPWGTLPVSQTCFHIYGTKRKAKFNECDNTSEQISTSVKRLCLQPVTHYRHTVEQSQPLTYSTSSSLEQQGMTSSSSCQPDSIHEQTQTAFQQPTSMQVESTDIVQSDGAQPQTLGFYNNSVHSIQSSDSAMSVSHLNHHKDQSETSKSNSWQHEENNQRLFEQRNQNRLEMHEDPEFESNDYWDVPNDHYLLKMADELEQARIAMETDDNPPHYQSSDLVRCDRLEIRNTGNHVRCYCKLSGEGLLEPVSYI